jgi:tetratricopeptide (TPR) repeat protein
LPAGDPERLESLFALAYPLVTAGRSNEARVATAELRASADPRFQAFGLVAETMADVDAGRFDARRAEEHLVTARNVFEGLGDDVGLAWAGFLEANMRWMRCRAALATTAALQAEVHARAAGDDRLAATMRSWSVMPLSFGPAPVAEALAAAQALLAEAKGMVDRAHGERAVGKLLAMRGEMDAARELVRAGIASSREAGQLVEAAGSAQTAAFVEMRAGELEAAEDALRAGIAELDRFASHGYRGTTALQLADVLAVRGEHEEAARWCAEVRETLNEDDLTDAVAANSLEGFLAAVSGSHAEGERLSEQAVGLAATIDMYESKGRAYEWHARTLSLVGKPAEARRAAATALAIYEAKGDIPASTGARELLDSLSA